MDLRRLLTEFRSVVERQTKAKVGAVRIRGTSRFQKQRDGSWMRLGKAAPDEIADVPLGNSSSLPTHTKQRKAVPEVKEPGIPLGRDWKDATLGRPESTMEDHFKDDEPKPTRKALHERILRTFQDHVDPASLEKKPVAVIAMGGPVSGRTQVVKGLAQEGDFVRVDSSAIAYLIPEFEEAVAENARNAPALVRKEACYVTRKLLDAAVEKRQNVAVDTVGADAGLCRNLVDDLHEAGYHVVLVHTVLDKVTGKDRAALRGEKTGYWTPPDAFNTYKATAATVGELNAAVDEVVIIDTQGAPQIQEAAFHELRRIFEELEPEEPAVLVGEVKKRALARLKADRKRLAGMPARFKKNEGVVLAHYDDAHLAALPEPKKPDPAQPGVPQ